MWPVTSVSTPVGHLLSSSLCVIGVVVEKASARWTRSASLPWKIRQRSHRPRQDVSFPHLLGPQGSGSALHCSSLVSPPESTRNNEPAEPLLHATMCIVSGPQVLTFPRTAEAFERALVSRSDGWHKGKRSMVKCVSRGQIWAKRFGVNFAAFLSP